MISKILTVMFLFSSLSLFAVENTSHSSGLLGSMFIDSNDAVTTNISGFSMSYFTTEWGVRLQSGLSIGEGSTVKGVSYNVGNQRFHSADYGQDQMSQALSSQYSIKQTGIKFQASVPAPVLYSWIKLNLGADFGMVQEVENYKIKSKTYFSLASAGNSSTTYSVPDHYTESAWRYRIGPMAHLDIDLFDHASIVTSAGYRATFGKKTLDDTIGYRTGVWFSSGVSIPIL